MVLHMIGIGLCDERDISVKGLEIVKRCDRIFLESYTSRLCCSKEDMEKLYGKEIILADRDLVEKNSDEIIMPAKDSDVAFLVIGDVFSATTHTDLLLRAHENGVEVDIIHNASVLTSIGVTGLELYKFGKTTSVPYPEDGFRPETPYEVLMDNLSLGYHTLLLLDLKADLNRFMTVSEAVRYLLEIEEKRCEGVFTKETRCIGCARLGCGDMKVVYGTASDIAMLDMGGPLHCLIVPGKLHFMEEEAIKRFDI
ncbi:diphthine synthase [Candidatus Woesearchaeota archaeon CG11_big_fil_rev_8_21_14_0_20_43_8]|nr:MAG: diphthine synthase [Candidatus Woesearchaeota archaeon CG11_big_fil_rev_8_21_14_0_20_43_8]PIO06666.1 MAG: diphthine synthase [Candidatus Woesearchaeota archaeon CG08_land_8_20_14_0_20_43_7]